jgi:hypothetical protein
MRPAALLAAALLAGGCVDIELQLIGPSRPSRPPGCAVQLIPEGKPPFPFTDVATGTVSCARNRDRCLEEMQKQACVVGADAVYGFAEKTESIYHHVTATYAARTP